MRGIFRASIIVMIAIVVVAILLLASSMVPTGKQVLRLGTTTSARDSGLLDYVLPDFESKYNCQVEVIAVGSGQAMTLGKNGDVDVLIVHSPTAEKQFVKDGYGTSRTLIAYNQFVIVGPLSDPANVSAAKNATDAFSRIYQSRTEGKATFVSRGDQSGTDVKEKAVWTAAGFNTTGFNNNWYLSTGQGMGAVLDITEQNTNGYTLADEATYWQRNAAGIIPHLKIVYQGNPFLFNQYSAIPINPEKWPQVNSALANQLVQWVSSPEIQKMIANYSVGGHNVFVPNAGPGALLEMHPVSSNWLTMLMVRTC